MPKLVFHSVAIFGLIVLGLAGCDNQADSINPSPDASITKEYTPNDQAREIGQASAARGGSPHALKVQRPRIVAFGNSLTAGLGVSPDQAYPSQLQRRLDQEGYRYRVINAGVSGDTTAGGLRRLDWVLRSRPTIVILELGANDGLRGHPLDRTFANLEQIIRRILSRGITVVLTGMRIPPNYGLEYTTEFSAMYEQLAGEFNVTLMPFFLEGVAARPELNQADGIHPTAEGYRIIVENLLLILEPILEGKLRMAS